MATNNSLQLFVSKVLPARTTYSKERNMFLANAYTSAAGNTYFQGIRLSERIKIKYDFGQGYCYLFLNGIHIYGFDGEKERLLNSRLYHCQGFCESFTKSECISMIKEYMCSHLKLAGASVNNQDIESFSNALVSDTFAMNPNRVLTA